MAKLINNKKKNLSIITQPWFVIIVVISCFGILTPKIFMPLFRQMTGSGRNDQPDRSTHNMRMRPMPSAPNPPPPDSAEFSRGSPQFGRPAPTYGQTSSSNSRSLLTFLLPVYATGIGIYMVYTLFKVFNKKEEDKKEEDEEEDFETSQKNKLKFLEKNLSNVRWDADDGEFKYVNKATSHFNRSEESEDELNDYERYKDLDPDYVEFLKEKRRIQKEKAKREALASTTKGSLKTSEIPLSPGSGITSITNTNVLMNDTLERMKFSLNKINNQLIEVEKKGGPLDDPELENLKLQLSQTEAQMLKIMSIVNNVSTTIQDNYAKQSQIEEEPPVEVEKEGDEEDELDIDDLHRQVELIKQVVNKTEKDRKSKNKRSNKNVYDKIRQNINAAEQLLRQRKKQAISNANESNSANEKLNVLEASQLAKDSSTSSSSSSSSNQQSDYEKDQAINHETDEDANESHDDEDVDDDEDDNLEDDYDDESDSDQSSDNQVETLKSKDKNV